VRVSLEARPSKNLIRPILVVLLTCLVIGSALVEIRRADADRRARFFTLPDGDQGEFLGTALGGAAFTTDTPWEHMARRLLPARFQQWVPAVFDVGAEKSIDSNTLMIYMRFFPRSEVNVGIMGGFTSMSYRWGSYEAEDDGGFRYPRYPGDMIVRHSSSGAEVYSLGVRAYPRRQRDFLLHWRNDDGTAIATLKAPNTMRGSFPAWRPLSLPQTQSNGPVTLTLENLQENTNGASPYLMPEYRMSARNSGWANANVSFDALFDAAGNESNPRLQAGDDPPVETPFHPGTNEIELLSSREPAWKLHAVVDRKRPQDFAAHEKLVLTNLPLPAPGQFIAIDRSADCVGVSIRAMILAGGGIFCVSNGGTRSMLPPDESLKGGGAYWSSLPVPVMRTWSSGMPFLLVETRNSRPGDEIQIHATDENGRAVGVEMHTYNPETNGDIGYEPTFDPPAGAKFLSITVAVSRPLSFEFLVNPSDVRTPEK
jgi:hypothetical protein